METLIKLLWILILLFGCAPVQIKQGEYYLKCFNMQRCYQRAIAACPEGYDIVDKRETEYKQFTKTVMLVRCR